VTSLFVVEPGPLTLVQDQGRPALAHLGVGASGAMDRAALDLANRLVGNAADAAGLEILFGGLAVRPTSAVWVATAGAWGRVAIDGNEIPPHTATLVSAGATLSFDSATHGIRYYLAIRGGVAVPPVLGSRSRDSLAHLGPVALTAGDSVPLGAEPASVVPPNDLIPFTPPATSTVTLGVRPGPRRDWFTEGSWEKLFSEEWRVSPRSDRSGVRLEGVALSRVHSRELPSEGMLPGAIQVSPDGAPTILAVDHPVTGGYPVIAVVTDESLDALAQLRPGQPISFRLATGRS